jgi:hypothetical protein
VIEDRVRGGVVAVALMVLLGGCAQPGSSGTVEAGDGVSDTVPRVSSSPSPVGVVPSAAAAVTCPPEGVRVEPGTGDAASGLRVLGITLTNCGKRTYRIDGYPAVRSLDKDRTALDVQVLKGVAEIAGPIPEWNAPPQPVTLKPGQRATAVVAWRNTYDNLEHPPVDVTFLEVAPLAGRPAQVIAPDNGLDLGSTGRIGVSAWRLDPKAAR